MRIPRITPAVARKLGHYVYLYVNPIDESIFYVGKGKGGRALAHLRADERQEVTKTIREIQAGGNTGPNPPSLLVGNIESSTSHSVIASTLDSEKWRY